MYGINYQCTLWYNINDFKLIVNISILIIVTYCVINNKKNHCVESVRCERVQRLTRVCQTLNEEELNTTPGHTKGCTPSPVLGGQRGVRRWHLTRNFLEHLLSRFFSPHLTEDISQQIECRCISLDIQSSAKSF